MVYTRAQSRQLYVPETPNLGVRSGRAVQAPRYIAMAYNAANLGFRAYNAYRRSSAHSGGRVAGQIQSGQGITSQYDRTLIYRRRKAPRRFRRRWRRLKKQVNAVINKGLGSKTIVFNNAITSNTNIAGGLVQALFFLHLYGCAGTGNPVYFETATRDLESIRTNDTTSDPTATYRFESAVMDITATNTSSTVTAEVDLYELWHYAETNFASLNDVMANAQSTTGTIGTAGSITLSGNRGVTLFDIPQMSVATRYKIVKKVKYFVPPGNCFTYQIRDPKNRVINSVEMLSASDGTGFVHKKWTKTVVILHKPLVGIEGDSAMTVGVTRKYMYKVLEQNAKEDGYNPT